MKRRFCGHCNGPSRCDTSLPILAASDTYLFISRYEDGRNWRGVTARTGRERSIDDYIQPLLFQPGEGWAYGPGLDWAGRVLEVVLGSTLEQIFQDFMWSSIGLRDTTFFPARRPSLVSRRARIYLADGDTFVPKDETPVPLNPRDCLGGLGIWSTPHEFPIFLFHLFIQSTLVKPETLALMSQMDSTAPKLSQDKFLQAPETYHCSHQHR
ncbi:hypothetical protein JX266_013832 [Neoarthrinium moseri]|nr:hypothetical protein JX266_013832 [Neoarthrinium moseri]